MSEFIGNLQFSQIHPNFEINIAEEIEKMTARNLNETLMCFISAISVSAQRF